MKLLVIGLITAFGLMARAEVLPPTLEASQVIQQLEQSGTVHAASLEAVKKYAASYQYVQSLTSINPLQKNDTRYFILSIRYEPKNAEELQSYRAIDVNVYFITPSHFETTIGAVKLNFYKIETVVNLVKSVGPQPG
jgi:hypothetical protein